MCHRLRKLKFIVWLGYFRLWDRLNGRSHTDGIFQICDGAPFALTEWQALVCISKTLFVGLRDEIECEFLGVVSEEWLQRQNGYASLREILWLACAINQAHSFPFQRIESHNILNGLSLAQWTKQAIDLVGRRIHSVSNTEIGLCFADDKFAVPPKKLPNFRERNTATHFSQIYLVQLSKQIIKFKW